MYSLIKIILVMYVSLLSMARGYNEARRQMCYQCESKARKGEDCYDKPRQFEFERRCDRKWKVPMDHFYSTAAHPAENANITTQARTTYWTMHLNECWLVRWRNSTGRYIDRRCGATDMPDTSVERWYKYHNKSLDYFKRCYADLCNSRTGSSDILSVGFFCSIFPLFFVYFITF